MFKAFFLFNYYFNDVYVFSIYIVFILGDLSCTESSDSFTDYPHG